MRDTIEMTSHAKHIKSLLILAFLIAAISLVSQGLHTWNNSSIGSSVAEKARAGDIYMVSSTTCPYCSQACAWFSQHNVPFTECFIERDAFCASRYEAMMTPGTPVLMVRGKKQIGFNPTAINAALAG